MINEEIYKCNVMIRKAGVTCCCPSCGKEFIKNNWQQRFCSLVCKDVYWNDKGSRHSEGYFQEYHNRVR